MSEQIVLRLGRRDLFVELDHVGWPPPERIQVPGEATVWVRTSYSQLPPEVADHYVIRGAQYEAQP